MVTGRQIRAALHMLGRNVGILCDKARVSRGETDRLYVARIQMALELTGIRFGRKGAVLMGIRGRTVAGEAGGGNSEICRRINGCRPACDQPRLRCLKRRAPMARRRIRDSWSAE